MRGDWLCSGSMASVDSAEQSAVDKRGAESSERLVGRFCGRIPYARHTTVAAVLRRDMGMLLSADVCVVLCLPFTAELLSAYGVAPALVAFTLSSISMGVPSNGGIGPWQWAVIFALGIYGTGQVEAAAFANLVLGCNTLLLVGVGYHHFRRNSTRPPQDGRDK